MNIVTTMCAFFMLYGTVHAKESTTTSFPESTHGYFSSTFIPNLSSSAGEHYMLEWILVSAVVVIFVTACLIINVMTRLRKRRSKPTTNIVAHRSGRQNTANTSRNVLQSMEIVHTSSGNKMILRENKTSYNVTNFTYIQSQAHVTQNGKHLCAKSSVSQVQTHPILLSACGKLQSEPTHTYDHIHEYDELENKYQPDQRYLRKLSANSTENISEKSFKYDCVVQHSNKTLRPPKPGHVVTKKTRKKVTVANSFSRHRNVNKQSSSSVDPPTFHANDNQTRPSEIHGTGSSAGPGSLDFGQKLYPASSSESEDAFTVVKLDSSNYSQQRRCSRKWNSQYFKPSIYVNIPLSTEFQADIKRQSVSQTFNHDSLGDVLDHSSALKRGHRRSQSCGALYENQMFAFNVRTSIDEDCYVSC